MVSVVRTPAISSWDRAEAISTAPFGSAHSTSPSMCCSNGTHLTVVHEAAVTTISEEGGKARLIPPTLRPSKPEVR